VVALLELEPSNNLESVPQSRDVALHVVEAAERNAEVTLSVLKGLSRQVTRYAT
jgi:hypothetical protein